MSYDQNVLTPPKEDLYHRWLLNVSVLTPTLLSVLKYLELYPKCFDVGRFHRMQTAEIQLQELNRIGRRRD